MKALSTFVVGRNVTESLGSVWMFAPQMRNLTTVPGGSVTGTGQAGPWLFESMA